MGAGACFAAMGCAASLSGGLVCAGCAAVGVVVAAGAVRGPAAAALCWASSAYWALLGPWLTVQAGRRGGVPGHMILVAESEPQVKVNCPLATGVREASCCNRLTFSLPAGDGVVWAWALAMAVEMIPLPSGGPVVEKIRSVHGLEAGAGSFCRSETAVRLPLLLLLLLPLLPLLLLAFAPAPAPARLRFRFRFARLDELPSTRRSERPEIGRAHV